MLPALRKPSLRYLWIGQAFSAIGDEIYRVGLTWFAIGQMGENTGYLVAAQTGSLMVLSFIGGKWADHWHPLKTMVSVDLIRAAIVLVPVVVSFFIPVPLAMLWGMALTLSAFSAFFEPAMQATIPLLAKSPDLRRSMNGLMSTTLRLARTVGPAIVGLLATTIPMIHFFTLDAITFLVSAGSIYSLWKLIPEAPPAPQKSVSFSDAILSGARLARGVPGMAYLFFSKGSTAGSWSLALMIGFPLLIHEMTGGDARSFGLVMTSYGVGNLLGALFFGNLNRSRSLFCIFMGYVAMGVGFVGMGLAQSISHLMILSALTGFSGPMNDLAFIDRIQSHFPVKEMGKMFRLRMALESAAMLVTTSLSPFLIRTFSVRAVIVGSGVVWILTGLGGFIAERKKFV
jgi:MFS transporter, DHA3 family, macrolide efflux protein